jgi:hypothetical protein
MSSQPQNSSEDNKAQHDCRAFVVFYQLTAGSCHSNSNARQSSQASTVSM